jgi:hypothetical protein
MRARETTGSQAMFTEQTLDEAGCAGLSVGAGDMDDSVNLLWVTEQLNQTASRV